MTAPPMSIPACRLRHRAQVHEALDVVVGYAGDVAAVEVHAAGTSAPLWVEPPAEATP